ncbi:MAG: MGMT family protein [Tissierellia bacterium]|nr:MGMT family protein [Tissierellia bacterium]
MFKKIFGKLFADEPKQSFDEPRIIEVKSKRALRKYGGRKKLIAPPSSYAELMRMVPEGKLITKDSIREYLIKKHQADYVDMLTSEIYINLVANESFEGKIEEVPYWRTVDIDGRLNPKFPGGIESQKRLLESEGHKIVQKDKFYYLKHYKNKLFKFPETVK